MLHVALLFAGQHGNISACERGVCVNRNDYRLGA